ncbi:MAG: NAD(P)(+) transhydrogenase (Re/Si-specific) subunit beta [Actinomycetota bacterium]
MRSLIPFAYIIAAACFVLSLKWLSHPATARRGVKIGELGMLIAVLGTLASKEIVSYEWILVAFVLGSLIGVPLAVFMPMKDVPQRTAISHAFGALAAALVGTAEYYNHAGELSAFTMGAIGIEVILGFLTFTGSAMAFFKLQEIVIPTRPVLYKGQNAVNLTAFAAAIGIAAYLVFNPGATQLFPILAALSLAFGVMLIIPIGGADMPTVIALLNSYAGLSASMMGFVLDNKLLIVAGALDGASGLILAIIMCRAMNRSFANVLFGGFGQAKAKVAGEVEERTVRSASPEEASSILEAASSVIVVPGYGMAVAQAQHKVRELYDVLRKRGCDVKFAIHPVAGRMPGHMNVLLAEADIPYTDLVEMDEINPELPQTDVALVVGANDVTNPAARHDESSPIYGMPILDVDKARTVMVNKRGMSAGFAGIENELFFMDKTLMLFGDAKQYLSELVKELAGSKV